MSSTPAANINLSVLRADLAHLSAYHVPPATGMIKLDAMENPFALPATLQAELATALAQAPVNRYPDPSASALKQEMRKAFGIDEGWELLLGNGSDEIIQLLIQAIAAPNALVLSVEPSFVMYKMTAAYNGVRYLGVPLTPEFELDTPALLETITREKPALTFISYPNNPTGNLFDPEAVAQIIRAAAPGLVVVDEAYQAFASDSFMPRLAEFDNLVVMRTVSKLGLAGLRLGYLVGHPAWLHEIDKLRLPYNINVLTQIAALTVLKNHEILDEQTQILREERAKLFEALQQIPALTVYASEANFILIRTPDAPSLHAALKNQQILVKNLHGGHPFLTNCLRLTIGTPEENALLLKALQENLNS